MKKLNLLGVLCGSALVLSSPASAALRTFDYTAEGSFLVSIDAYLGVQITYVSGEFTFDDSALTDGPLQTGSGFTRQNYDGAIASMTAVLRENSSTGTFASYDAVNGEVSVRDGTSGVGDAGSVFFRNAFGATLNGAPEITLLGMDIFSNTETGIFNSTSLSAFSDSIGTWSLGSPEFEIRFASNGGFVENGGAFKLTGLTERVSAVPIPSAVWLFGSGLLGLVGVAKRKKR